MNDALQTSNLSNGPRNSARAGVVLTGLKGLTTMTMIYLATDSSDNTPIAFSNIGTALEYVNDSHADLNTEGAALMLRDGRTRGALLPATNKAVKAARGILRFESAAADAASVVAGIQSKLTGALAACALVGIDPANVAKIADLNTALLAAQESVCSDVNAVSFTITPVVLHKRGYKN